MASLKWESQRIKHCRPRVPQWLNCAVIQCSCSGHWMTRRFRRLHSFSQHCPWYRWRLPKRSRNPSGSSPYLHIQRALHRAATTKNSPKFEHPGRLSSFLFFWRSSRGTYFLLFSIVLVSVSSSCKLSMASCDAACSTSLHVIQRSQIDQN